MQILCNHPFCWLSNITLYIWTTSSLSICLLKGILAPSTVWLLCTLLLWTLGCIWPFFSLHLYLCGKYSVMHLPGHRVALFLNFWGTYILFSKVAVPTGDYAKWNKSSRERQLSYGFTYMQNIRNSREDIRRRKGKMKGGYERGWWTMRDYGCRETNWGL